MKQAVAYPPTDLYDVAVDPDRRPRGKGGPDGSVPSLQQSPDCLTRTNVLPFQAVGERFHAGKESCDPELWMLLCHGVDEQGQGKGETLIPDTPGDYSVQRNLPAGSVLGESKVPLRKRLFLQHWAGIWLLMSRGHKREWSRTLTTDAGKAGGNPPENWRADSLDLFGRIPPFEEDAGENGGPAGGCPFREPFAGGVELASLDCLQ